MKGRTERVIDVLRLLIGGGNLLVLLAQTVCSPLVVAMGFDWSKAPTFLPHLLSQINDHTEARFVTINEKLILKIANPLLTSPKCVHSHLLQRNAAANKRAL